MSNGDSEVDEDHSVGTEHHYGDEVDALLYLLEDVGSIGGRQSWSAGFCTFADRLFSSDHPCRSLRFRDTRKMFKRA